MKWWSACWFLLCGSVCAQVDLVPNPSFEEISACPDDYSQISRAAPWQGFAFGGEDVDLFHACGKKAFGVPRNFTGEARARTGHGYAGLFVWYPQFPTYREFLQVPLEEPLRPGRTYEAVMYVRRASYRTVALGGMGFVFTSDSLRPHAGNWTDFTPQVARPPGEPVEDSHRWTKISGRFRARGDERWLTIGVFAPNDRLT
ncbi:MAG: hypothetical protein WBA12_14910, partial [Catalinimonas sp.]